MMRRSRLTLIDWLCVAIAFAVVLAAAVVDQEHEAVSPLAAEYVR